MAKKKADKKPQKKVMAKKPLKKRGKKVVKQVTLGNAYIKATYNNTIITLTDANGDVIITGSAGQSGFRGPKKSTPFAAGIIVSKAIDKARITGLKEVNVFVKGVGSGREAAIRAINTNGIHVVSVKDTTPIPHNGCRAKKPRRV
jgi:small subunit ribosomal protein S11